jgi:hypothetical protein
VERVRGALSPAWLGRALIAVVARPALWGTGASQLFTLARPRWWARWPPLPVPDEDYLRFRLITMYGGRGDRAPEPAELVDYLKWCRRMRKLSR